MKKLSKKTHVEYKMSEKQLKEIELQNYLNQAKQSAVYYREELEYQQENKKPIEFGEQVGNIYIYHESSFSVKMKDIPPRLIQAYYFLREDKVELEIILGGGDESDVYEVLKSKNHFHIINENSEKENIEILLYSNGGINRKIILEDIKVVEIEAFQFGSYESNELCKAKVVVKYESKKIEKI